MFACALMVCGWVHIENRIGNEGARVLRESKALIVLGLQGTLNRHIMTNGRIMTNIQNLKYNQHKLINFLLCMAIYHNRSVRQNTLVHLTSSFAHRLLYAQELTISERLHIWLHI